MREGLPRGRLLRLLSISAVLLFAGTGLFADPPAVIELSRPNAFGAPSRAPVRFTHADHMTLDGVSCLTCHHDFKNGKNILDPGRLVTGDPSLRCATCHTRPRDFQRVSHRLCIGCHDAEKRKGGVTGPRQCGECHAWKR